MHDEPENVSATVELSGSYEQIAELLGQSGDESQRFEPIVADLNAVLETVVRTDGATKSQLVEALPATAGDLDTESVIHALRLLEQYDLVTLDENTWRPGPDVQD
jgi:hypothetical protein